MIVNTQIFSYRLAIGVLVIAISVLGVFGYVGYNDLKSENNLIKQEKKLIQSEISKVISNNNKLKKNNELLSKAIKDYRNVIATTSDSVRDIKSNTTRVIASYKRIIDDFRNQSTLTEDSIKPTIKVQDNDITSSKEAYQKEQYNAVKSKIDKFSNVSKNETIIFKESFKAWGYRIKNGELKTKTAKANRTNSIEVCFTLTGDVGETSANELYIQIIDPNNNIVSDQGAKKFDDLSLIYSLKTKPISDYKNVNVCEYVYSDVKLPKGRYLINIFDNYTQLGSTRLELY